MKKNKFSCKKCEKHFYKQKDVLRSEVRCPFCGSSQVKFHPGLVPEAAFIKAFILYETKKCRACGRPLKSDRSIKLGFGPTCGLYYAGKYFDQHPDELGDKAKKIWTKEEIDALVQFATTVRKAE